MIILSYNPKVGSFLTFLILKFYLVKEVILKSILIFCLLYYFLDNIAVAQEGTSTASTITFKDEDFDFEDFVAPKINDPFEKLNRKIFTFNEVLDQYFFEYVAEGYGRFVPKLVRKSVRNFLNNLSMPLIAVNSVLQGNIDNSLASFSHFLINSTIGVGGLFDVATKKDIKYHEEDFGQTFAVYGIKSGPYLVLPFAGPNSLRGSFGLLVEKLVDPLSLNILEVGGDRQLLNNEVLVSASIMDVIDKRESLLKVIDDAREDSFDFYVTAKSAYIQRRNFQINNE